MSRKGWNKAVWAAIVAVLMMSFIFVGCGAPEGQSDEVVLKFWQFSLRPEILTPMIERFEAENPGVRVKVEQLTWDAGLQRIIISTAAGNNPDVCEFGSTHVPKFSFSGALMDLTDPTAAIHDDYLGWESGEAGGRYYAMPWFLGTRMLFYNRALFRRAGLDPDRPPRTWAELEEYAKRISALGTTPAGKRINGFGIDVAEEGNPWQLFMPFAWGNGARILSEDLTEPTLTDPRFVEALEFYQSLKPYSLTERMGQLMEAFAQQESLGMFLSGAWCFRAFPNMNPTLNYGVALVPAPGPEVNPEGTPASFAGGQMLAVFNNTEHPEEALKFVEFMAAPEQVMTLVRVQQNIVPAAIDAKNDPFFEANPNLAVTFEQMLTAVPPPPHPQFGKFENYLALMVDKAILEDRPALEVLQETQAKMREVLEKEVIESDLDDAAINMGILGLFTLTVIGMGIYCVIKKKRMGYSYLKDWTTYVFLAPWAVIFLIFGLYPILYSIVLSFMNYNLLSGESAFVGLAHYADALTSEAFLMALWHTIFFGVGTVPFTMVLAIFTAVLINRKMPFKQIYQSGFFLPTVTSVIVISTIFSYIYVKDGILDEVLKAFEIDPYRQEYVLDDLGNKIPLLDEAGNPILNEETGEIEYQKEPEPQAWLLDPHSVFDRSGNKGGNLAAAGDWCRENVPVAGGALAWLLTTFKKLAFEEITWPLLCIMGMAVWSSFGYYMILFLAGLQGIPEELYEAAAIDGANEWQNFTYITVPMLRPIMLFVFVINTIYSFQVFPEIFVMTQGGPVGKTNTAVYMVYETGFTHFEMGSASAMAYIVFMVILVFSLIQMKWFGFSHGVGE